MASHSLSTLNKPRPTVNFDLAYQHSWPNRCDICVTIKCRLPKGKRAVSRP